MKRTLTIRRPPSDDTEGDVQFAVLCPSCGDLYAYGPYIVACYASNEFVMQEGDIRCVNCGEPDLPSPYFFNSIAQALNLIEDELREFECRYISDALITMVSIDIDEYMAQQDYVYSN